MTQSTQRSEKAISYLEDRLRDESWSREWIDSALAKWQKPMEWIPQVTGFSIMTPYKAYKFLDRGSDSSYTWSSPQALLGIPIIQGLLNGASAWLIHLIFSELVDVQWVGFALLGLGLVSIGGFFYYIFAKDLRVELRAQFARATLLLLSFTTLFAMGYKEPFHDSWGFEVIPEVLLPLIAWAIALAAIWQLGRGMYIYLRKRDERGKLLKPNQAGESALRLVTAGFGTTTAGASFLAI